MGKITFLLKISGTVLFDTFDLSSSTEALHVNVEYPVDGRFNIERINVIEWTPMPDYEPEAVMLEIYIKYEYPRDSDKQNRIIKLVEDFVNKYLENLDVQNIQDGDEIEIEDDGNFYKN